MNELPGPVGATMTHNQALGRYGETLAARHLVSQGMVLLERNWRCPDGEIDLVLRDGEALVVCEVKTRSSNDFGSPHEAITGVKVARLRRLAAAWLAAHDARPIGVRIDFVAIVRPRRGNASLEHVRGVG
jgi:putative endonuclease